MIGQIEIELSVGFDKVPESRGALQFHVGELVSYFTDADLSFAEGNERVLLLAPQQCSV